jgi:hypothetical protein
MYRWEVAALNRWREGGGALKRVLEDAVDSDGLSMGDLTVLATQNDPYRRDTRAGHLCAQWFKQQFTAAGRERIHLRGLHYAIVARGDVLKPNGKPYINTDDDWEWLQGAPAKCARWLGYVPFDAIVDERNEPPITHRRLLHYPRTYVSVGIDVEIPDVDDIKPKVRVYDFEGQQPYRW